MIYCLEWFQPCSFVGIFIAPHNWGDQLPWYHMYHWSCSSPSIRTSDQLNSETFEGNRFHCKVNWINCLGRYWIDFVNGGWNMFGYAEYIMKSRNYNCKFAKEVHIPLSAFINIHWIDRQYAQNWQLRSLRLPNLTMTHGSTTSC